MFNAQQRIQPDDYRT